LRKAVFFVATNPVAYRKLQAEIDAVAVKANLSPSNAAPNYQLRAMPYLQAAIKEVLRLWPPVIGLTARMSHRDDVTSGVPLSTDTHVAWALWAITKNKTFLAPMPTRLCLSYGWIQTESASRRWQTFKASCLPAAPAGSVWGSGLRTPSLEKLCLRLVLPHVHECSQMQSTNPPLPLCLGSFSAVTIPQWQIK